MAQKRTGKPNGRPATVIAQNEFETLCAVQATLDEIASHFNCSDDAVNRWCRKTYGTTFAGIHEQKRRPGLISLRRKMFQLALAGDKTMLIWLSKQHLGMSDKWQATGTGGGPLQHEYVVKFGSEL